MNLEVKLIAGFILHFVGDYLLQTALILKKRLLRAARI